MSEVESTETAVETTAEKPFDITTVPVEILAKHPAFQEVKAESIKRKEKIRELEATRQQTATQEPEQTAPPPADDRLDRLAQAVELLVKRETERSEVAEVNAIVSEFKLDDADRAVLASVPSSSRKLVAEALAARGRKFDPSADAVGKPTRISADEAIKALDAELFKPAFGENSVAPQPLPPSIKATYDARHRKDVQVKGQTTRRPKKR